MVRLTDTLKAEEKWTERKKRKRRKRRKKLITNVKIYLSATKIKMRKYSVKQEFSKIKN